MGDLYTFYYHVPSTDFKAKIDMLQEGNKAYLFFFFVMLCYVMLCYVMLCYVMLCYVMISSIFVDRQRYEKASSIQSNDPYLLYDRGVNYYYQMLTYRIMLANNHQTQKGISQ